jgi:hypothetical protein
MKVEVTESEYRNESAFIDADELPELIRGIEALIAVTANPTQFRNFEVHYKTRGSLNLVAFNDQKGNISYAIEAGKITKASAFTNENGMAALKEAFLKAQEKLNGVAK